VVGEGGSDGVVLQWSLVLLLDSGTVAFWSGCCVPARSGEDGLHMTVTVAAVELGLTSVVCVDPGMFSMGVSKKLAMVIGRGGVGKRMPNS
jgi:hypothetical protein